jgi:lipoyl synthase
MLHGQPSFVKTRTIGFSGGTPPKRTGRPFESFSSKDGAFSPAKSSASSHIGAVTGCRGSSRRFGTLESMAGRWLAIQNAPASRTSARGRVTIQAGSRTGELWADRRRLPWAFHPLRYTWPVPQRLPEWLTVRIPRPETIKEVEGMMRSKNLHTVCESARCPNLPECWSKKTATFMILGDTCTRSCGFCAIKVGRGLEVDPFEPLNVAQTAKTMGMKHVVVTSVARDDLADEGAGQFAKTIEQLHKVNPDMIVEVLTPDFKGKTEHIETVCRAHPEIYNHNIETVERLHTIVRPQAKYDRTLGLLAHVKDFDPTIYTKSGIMLGLGETRDEVVRTLEDLRTVGVDAVTIGQYLRPTMRHLPVVEYIHPDVFKEYESIGDAMGFAFVASGPFIRSSYNAIEFSKKVMAERLARMEAEPASA